LGVKGKSFRTWSGKDNFSHNVGEVKGSGKKKT